MLKPDPNLPPYFSHSESRLNEMSDSPYLCAEELCKLSAWIAYESKTASSESLDAVIKRQAEILELFRRCRFVEEYPDD